MFGFKKRHKHNWRKVKNWSIGGAIIKTGAPTSIKVANGYKCTDCGAKKIDWDLCWGDEAHQSIIDEINKWQDQGEK